MTTKDSRGADDMSHEAHRDRHLLLHLVRFGDISKESRFLIWLLIAAFILEILKTLARHG